jgi:hypothetical protein
VCGLLPLDATPDAMTLPHNALQTLDVTPDALPCNAMPRHATLTPYQLQETPYQTQQRRPASYRSRSQHAAPGSATAATMTTASTAGKGRPPIMGTFGHFSLLLAYITNSIYHPAQTDKKNACIGSYTVVALWGRESYRHLVVPSSVQERET